MQLGDVTTAAAATAATAPPPPQSNDSAATEAAVGAFEVSEEMNDRGFGGNRWPREETLALLKIRSDMGIAFRDANVKGPLWDEVSRKMAEFGYIRNAKKCKEKFENVYKYHKRTKDGRTAKSDGKTYRFFDQLEALETHQPQPPRPQPHNNSIFSTPPPVTTTTITPHNNNIPLFPNISGDFLSDNSTSSSSSYSTSSDVEIGGGNANKKKKRKWKDFVHRLMKQVVDKQEELQIKFLEAVEKRERDRIVREESWRMQEIDRINRERKFLAEERELSAAKDAAVMAFLHRFSEKPVPQFPTLPPFQPPQPQQIQSQMQPNNNNNQQIPQPPQPLQRQPIVTTLETTKTNNVDQNLTIAAPSASTAGSASSSRWPKVEIEALISLRTNLDSKYLENGPKGPLWEEISSGMKRLGFNRNSKRCKEKWENINKYFKKVKESNKKRPQDSKTCPYFHQLDALYRERNNTNSVVAASSSSAANSGLIKPDNSVPLMVQPEQQWPPANVEASQPLDDDEEEEEGGTEEEYDDEEDEEEEEEGGEFEVVPSNNMNNMDNNNV
ncbi:unnamed protein product [Cochlearia groenlandica]